MFDDNAGGCMETTMPKEVAAAMKALQEAADKNRVKLAATAISPCGGWRMTVTSFEGASPDSAEYREFLASAAEEILGQWANDQIDS